MMRVTNSMIVKRSKTNINANRAQVDYTNNQMAIQKKITKPSDNPIIAIRALRLRTTLSTVTQYYENNIPDTESWMDITETALTNMKSLITSAYEQVVYGSTDSLNQDNRKTILKELQELQEQVYCEGNSDYAGRTVFTGYKTNQDISFIDSNEASKASYQISERYSYKDIEQKKYYKGSFLDTSNEALLGGLDEDVDDETGTAGKPELFEEIQLNRLRLAYDKISSDKGSSLTISTPLPDSTDGKTKMLDAKIGSDGSITVGGIQIALDEDGNINEDQIALENGMNGYYAIYDSDLEGYRIYKMDQMDMEDWEPPEIDEDIDPDEEIEPEPLYPDLEPKEGEEDNYLAIVKIKEKTTEDGDTVPYLSYHIGTASEEDTDDTEDGEGKPTDIVYRVVSSTADLKKSGYEIQPNEIVFDAESGELLFHDDMAQLLDAKNTCLTMDYEKTGFDLGELRPENYFNCTKHTADKGDIVYENYDEDWNWNQEAIYYNIAGGQQMRINTEARDVFDSNIRRDMDDLIDIVNFAISAQNTVDEITKKIESGEYTEEEVSKMKQWLDAANKQLDYANQNMHDTYSAYITRFQGYLNTINLEITDIGGRGERVELTKNRMSIQQSTFKELKSANEDMDLSDLVINYSAASVAYQAALQSAAKINQMTLLNYI